MGDYILNWFSSNHSRRFGAWLCIDRAKQPVSLNKINVHDLHEYSTFFLIG